MLQQPNLDVKERRRRWQLSDWWLHMYIFVYPAASRVAGNSRWPWLDSMDVRKKTDFCRTQSYHDGRRYWKHKNGRSPCQNLVAKASLFPSFCWLCPWTCWSFLQNLPTKQDFAQMIQWVEKPRHIVPAMEYLKSMGSYWWWKKSG